LLKNKIINIEEKRKIADEQRLNIMHTNNKILMCIEEKRKLKRQNEKIS
jgi:hypothetical protein